MKVTSGVTGLTPERPPGLLERRVAAGFTPCEVFVSPPHSPAQTHMKRTEERLEQLKAIKLEDDSEDEDELQVQTSSHSKLLAKRATEIAARSAEQMAVLQTLLQSPRHAPSLRTKASKDSTEGDCEPCGTVSPRKHSSTMPEASRPGSQATSGPLITVPLWKGADSVDSPKPGSKGVDFKFLDRMAFRTRGQSNV